MDEQVFSDQRVKDLIAEAFVPVRIDSAQNQSDFDVYGVQYIPTIIILDKDGRELFRANSQSVDEFLDVLNKYASK